MPGHFDGPAPTMAPTLFDEDLPWLGFHFDTKQVMFKKIDDDTPKPPTRMAPSKFSTKLARFDNLFQNVKSRHFILSTIFHIKSEKIKAVLLKMLNLARLQLLKMSNLAIENIF